MFSALYQSLLRKHGTGDLLPITRAVYRDAERLWYTATSQRYIEKILYYARFIFKELFYLVAILLHVSRNDTVRLKTKAPVFESTESTQKYPSLSN